MERTPKHVPKHAAKQNSPSAPESISERKPESIPETKPVSAPPPKPVVKQEPSIKRLPKHAAECLPNQASAPAAKSPPKPEAFRAPLTAPKQETVQLPKSSSKPQPAPKQSAVQAPKAAPKQVPSGAAKPKDSQHAEHISKHAAKPASAHPPKSTAKDASAKSLREHQKLILLAAAIVLLIVILIVSVMLWKRPDPVDEMPVTITPVPTLMLTPEPTPVSTPVPTPEPTPIPTPTAIPTPTPQPKAMQEINVSMLSADVLPTNSEVDVKYKLYVNGEKVSSFNRDLPVHFPDSAEYNELEGVTTFRGSNYRDGGAFGTVPNGAHSLSIQYSFNISGLDRWRGVGWTGQPSIVRWPDDVKSFMNIYSSKKSKEDLVEVIYATLDGHIYFFDLEDGSFTRDPINVGGPIKGSVTVDPRGYPLLYCGQGIDKVDDKPVKIGMRVFSLVDSSLLLFINGRDDFATRKWYSSDAAPLVDPTSDNLFWPGENGLFYSVSLNTNYDPMAGTISIDPKIDRYWYSSDVTERPGMENSPAIYNHYCYFVDNSGLMTCLDLNTLTPVWTFMTGDDTDASIVIEEADDGVWLYTGNELDLTGSRGDIQMRCINAMTGEVRWTNETTVTDNKFGGCFATPAIGKGVIDDLIIFDVGRTTDGNMLFAYDKVTGALKWELNVGGLSWSSPTISYDENGTPYLFVANGNGIIRMIDPVQGTVITTVNLNDENIEGSPAIFNDMLVVGTRSHKIYGVKIS